MMNRREASKKETRQLILRAARRLFAQKGMEECTIRDIARKAGVSPASVVVHFKSKTALLEEALNRAPELFGTQHAYTNGHFPQSFEISSVGGWVLTMGSGQARPEASNSLS